MIFHNPYHFVPVGHEPRVALSKANLESGNAGHVTHDRYAAETFSGRLICRLTTEDPIFIGHMRTKGSPQVSPFELDGKPAIPATSLRGLLSSIAEAASNSALRVLEDRLLSRRMDFNAQENLPALGMLVEKLDAARGKTTLELLPLTLPPLGWNDQTRTGTPNRNTEPYRQMFATMREALHDDPILGSHVPLKRYVEGYEVETLAGCEKRLRVTPGEFLDQDALRSYSADNTDEFWYLRRRGSSRWLDQHAIRVDQPHLSQNRQWLLGEKADARPISRESWLALDPAEQRNYVRGILRILGINHRETDIPTGKKHEMFIPFPEGLERAPTYDVKAALAKFERLADQRTLENDALPFELKGANRNGYPGELGHKLRLRAGDLVFFKAQMLESDTNVTPRGRPGQPGRGIGQVRIVDRRGQAVTPTATPADVTVTDIAVSSIWRSEAGGSVHQFFGKISKELLPFHAERDLVTQAEAVFGFVEHRKKDEARPDEALALGSRVRFSFGHLAPGDERTHYLPPMPLKALLSPKPPSPSLYFKKRTGRGHIAKKNLSLDNDVPQGRKFYLHRLESEPAPWKTQLGENEGDSMRSVVTPIAAGRQFFFRVDFDNLNRQELALLCYAVRPSESFRHKLGMGKSIGLGRVRIDPIGIFFVDRPARYGPGGFALAGDRYHGLGLGSGMPSRLDDLAGDKKEGQKTPAVLRALYPREAAEWNKLGASSPAWPTFDQLRAGCNVEPDIARALELLGDPSQVRNPVHTPQVIGAEGKAMEEKSYEWFVANDQGPRQFLEPLTRDSTELPTLRRLPRPQPRP